MANIDTIAALKGGTGRNQIAVLNLTSTTETLFVVNTDTTGVQNTAVLTVPSGNTGQTMVGSGSPIEYNQNGAISSGSYGRKVLLGTEAPYFSASTFDGGRMFKLRLTGTASVSPTATTTVTNTVLINVYCGTATTSAYKIATLTAAGTNSSTTAAVNGQFGLEAFVQWDSTTQTLSGNYDGNNFNVYKTPASLANQVTVTSAANLVFVASAVFGNAAGGSVSVSEFAVDQI